MSGPIGCFPGTFDPPTVAHLAVAEAAVAAAGLARLDLVLSRDPLGKPDARDSIDQRAAALGAIATDRAWLGVAVRDERLIADLASGYDAVVVGADKWRQMMDPAWYPEGLAGRDSALARMPLVLVAPRDTDDLADLDDLPGLEVRRLDLDVRHRPISSSAVRARRPEAAGWAVRGPGRQ